MEPAASLWALAHVDRRVSRVALAIALYRQTIYNSGMTKKQATSIRLSPEAKRLLAALAKKLGVNQTAIMEIAIRRLAELEHIS